MYIPEFLELNESSTAGKGIFSKTEIKAGTYIGDYTGIKYKNRAEFVEKYGTDFRYCCFSSFPWNPIISAKEERNFISYINESNTPNVYIKRYKLYALIDINKGGELFLKYPRGYTRNYSL